MSVGPNTLEIQNTISFDAQIRPLESA